MRLDPDKFASLVVRTIKSALEPLQARLSVLEAREPVHGKDGALGPQGEKGDTGAPGERGEVGPQGPQGERGERGEPGPQGDAGPVGPAGEKGLTGEPGRDGRDGQPGVPGVTGEKGLDGINGRDGADGKDGKDGLGFDDLSVDYDGERTITLKFQRGDVIKSFPVSMPVVLYRGTYDPGKPYEKGDAVTWGGSMWIARESTHSVNPDENSTAGKKAWALSVMRGRQGKQGPTGQKGDAGPQGAQGIQGPRGY